jgi:GntR family transcriptional regulator
MAYEIDQRSAVPSYRQLAGQLRAEIEAGDFSDRPLPSNKQLVQETGLAMMTVRHAIEELEKEGLVIAVPGRGTFVRER